MITIYDRLPEGLVFDLETMTLEGIPKEFGLFSWAMPLTLNGRVMGTIGPHLIRVQPLPAPYAFAGIPSGRQRRAPRGRRTAEQRK